MSRCAVLILVLALGIEFQLSGGVEVTVNNTDNKLCLYGNLMVNFSVTYEIVGNTSKTVEFPLPDKVTTVGSSCDDKNSLLKLGFGDGHSWSVAFANKGKTYQADSIVFSYNLNDAATFPNSSSNETVLVSVTPHITDVDMDTCYACKSKDTFEAKMVNQTLWNVLIQAFVSNGSKSENYTMCAADLPTTSAAPTTHVTSTTSAAPTTNYTTPAPVPTTTPTPTLPTPSIGNYVLKKDVNSTACLLASFGLRIGFMQVDGDKYEEMNLEPNATVTGRCGVNGSSELVLTSNTITIMFSFTNDTNKFRLHALNVTAKPSSGVVFTDTNSNLSLWEASLGSSYMCNAKQNYNITSLLTLYTFNLRVQPFGVENNVFSTAEDCQPESFLIPIIVGAALLVLILIVLLAFFIGRKRNMATEECFLDSDLSFLVPIAVGVALSFLIILVLISYLIGRRKSRTGYQSV